ncbi:MAG TPA: nuclear transport factor 2 family protein, partial [Mycobacterium sp.]|nr:nuclear transport factor 2 family protein [Mycobacterium sp.]
DPKTAPPLEGVDEFVPMVMGGLENVATMHPSNQKSHTPEISLTSATAATGIWAMEDLLVFGDGRELHGAGHYHETYEKRDGSWQIKSLHLTRTILKLSGDDG